MYLLVIDLLWCAADTYTWCTLFTKLFDDTAAALVMTETIAGTTAPLAMSTVHPVVGEGTPTRTGSAVRGDMVLVKTNYDDNLDLLVLEISGEDLSLLSLLL